MVCGGVGPLGFSLQQRQRRDKVGKKSTYRAVQAVSPGKLELAEKPVLDPSAGHVRIRVEACGVCHSDSATVEGVLPIEWPRVPGHEAVGRIDAIGEGVEGWKLDQRVGVGFLGGNCGYCDYCRDGDLVNCANQGYTGVQHDGGYAEMTKSADAEHRDQVSCPRRRVSERAKGRKASA